MRVDKIILRATLSTLAAIFCLIGIMIFALCYLFPATMMNIAYDLGMDNASITCAKRSYKRTDEVCYIAFATEVAIIAENDEAIADCGKRFISDDAQAFQAYCVDKNQALSSELSATYEQYVFGQICAAEYRLGDKAQALEDAFAYLHGAFPANNSVVTLLFTALQENDGQTVGQIQTRLVSLSQTNNLTETDGAYLQEILTALGA